MKTEAVPQDCLRSIFVPIPKKPGERKCDEFRFISLMSFLNHLICKFSRFGLTNIIYNQSFSNFIVTYGFGPTTVASFIVVSPYAQLMLELALVSLNSKLMYIRISLALILREYKIYIEILCFSKTGTGDGHYGYRKITHTNLYLHVNWYIFEGNFDKTFLRIG